MRTLLATLAAGSIALSAAAANPAPLPGVSDEETSIPSGGISQFYRGKGDALFVLARAGRWYRVGLNEGCLKDIPRIESLAFGNAAGFETISRFTQVHINQPRGATPVNCRIESIRRSEAPPQVDSNSPVTLD